MSELNKKELHKKILNELSSSDSKTILKSIQSLREEGIASDIPILLDVVIEKKDPSISKAVWNLLIDVKEEKAGEIIIEAIENERYASLRKELVAVCWESRLNFSQHLDVFVEILIQENFETAFEAFTVIENMTGIISEKKKEEIAQKLKDAIANATQERKGFLHEAIHLVKAITDEEKY
jgi:hypothetical protein